MGAKYLPTARDVKASKRFQLKQSALPKLKKGEGKKIKQKCEQRRERHGISPI
jgi:hypothetical protein